MRRLFNTTEMLALAIYRILEMRGTPVPHEAQKKISAHNVIKWMTGDHYPIRYEMGGSTHPSNGQALFNARGVRELAKLGITVENEHATKTYRKDIPEIARSKRLVATREIEENRKRLLAKNPEADYGHTEEPGKKPKRRMQSRGFQKAPDGTKFNWRTKRYERSGE